MATVLPHQTPDRAQADRRVRHPLQSLRGYIRTYVLLEGAGVALLYLGLWFWVGLALDYGPFRLFAFDWVEELNAAAGEGAGLAVRIALLALLSAGLLALVGYGVVTRLFREFRDAALALVLERRFPRELGDRLITAVELANPSKAARYGFSQAMVDHTVRDAADRVERLPIRRVFNWGRLVRLWVLAGLCSLGIYLLVFLGFAVYALAADVPAGGFFRRSLNVGSIWFERNVLLMDSYWPRSAYLEVLRFQDAPDHPGEMRVARDEQRPELLVRAVQWVVADRAAEGGWRPLRWKDLPGLVDADLLDVKLPAEYQGWAIDLDDLDPSLPAGAMPPEWNGQLSGAFLDLFRNKDPQGWARGTIPSHPYLLVDNFTNKGMEVGGKKLPPLSTKAVPFLRRLLDWHDWTVDKIAAQLDNAYIRQRMRHFAPEEYRKLEKLFTRLAELADDPAMERRLRKLDAPEQVFFSYRGQTTKSETPHERGERNSYLVSLADLKESVRFTFRGDDYYTPTRTITLVPPPGLVEMTMDREEPAYIYWRLQGDQAPLKGRRQLIKNVPVSITGEVTSIPLPLGGSVRLHGRTDRPLQRLVALVPPVSRKVPGSTTPSAPVEVDDDGMGFRLEFRDVVRPVEFELQFLDRDGVKGRRHVAVEPVDDRGPQEALPVELTVVLRNPKLPGGKAAPGAAALGLLITPDAQLPFKGIWQDDYGLTDVSWEWHVEEVEFELIGKPAARGDKGGAVALAGNPGLRRPGLVVSGLQGAPGALGDGWVTPLYWAWVDWLVAYDLSRAGKGPTAVDGRAALEVFTERLKERDDDPKTGAVPLVALDDLLRRPPPRPAQLRTHSLDRTEYFDFRKHLPKLKSHDPTREAQLHYRVRLFVSATDNNVETGNTPAGTKVQNKVPITFLVVSETELLAQILLEEEVLRERLEKAVERLKAGKTILDEQAAKLVGADVKLSLVGLRADEVRKQVQDATSAVREVSSDYNRILKEMEVNRVREDRLDRVDTKICKPLDETLNPNTGHFSLAESSVSRLWEGVEADVARLRQAEEAKQKADVEANREGHRKAAVEAQEHLGRLIERLEQVLDAIGGELTEGEAIALLVEIERRQRDQANELRRLRDEEERRLLELLTGKSK